MNVSDVLWPSATLAEPKACAIVGGVPTPVTVSVSFAVPPGPVSTAEMLPVVLNLIPVVVAFVTVVPHGARGATFELGMLGAAAAAMWGVVVARHALEAGTQRVVTAYAAAILGLVVGITLVLVFVSSAVGLFA